MTLLNVADIRYHSRVNGPGVRAVVWVQGCTIGCPGCFNPHTHIHAARRLLDPVRLGQRLARIPGTDGVTISGGEPFGQAHACSLLARAVRTVGRTVMVFTGYRFVYLRRSQLRSVQRFLNSIDLLVAGPYVRDVPGDVSTWRSSGNQTIHFLTQRLAGARRGDADARPVVEITLDGRRLASSGFPTESDRTWITQLCSDLKG